MPQTTGRSDNPAMHDSVGDQYQARLGDRRASPRAGSRTVGSRNRKRAAQGV